MGNFKMKIEKKVGKRTYEFTVEGENLHEAVMESKKLSFYDVHECGCCGSDNLVLDAHVAQDTYSYTTIKCNKCKASVNFGQQKKSPDVFYIRTRDNGQGGKEADWKKAPTPEGQAPQAPQQVAQQQTTNYQNTGAPTTGAPTNGEPQPRQ